MSFPGLGLGAAHRPSSPAPHPWGSQQGIQGQPLPNTPSVGVVGLGWRKRGALVIPPEAAPQPVKSMRSESDRFGFTSGPTLSSYVSLGK